MTEVVATVSAWCDVPRFAAGLVSLMTEVGELKRVRSAGRSGSVAERLFSDGWARLLAGAPVTEAMRGHVSASLSSVRLGDLDAQVLRDLDVADGDIELVLQRAFDAVAGAVDPALVSMLAGPRRQPPSVRLPDFVNRLAGQSRAGVTCPGKPRLVFEPSESHAEHCAIVAIYGALLSPMFGADPSVVWLASLAHHLHNAFIPDAGYTGEMLLGAHLSSMMDRATARCLAQLPRAVAACVADAMRILPDASSAEGRAFHAADTLDRVWQIDQHLRAGRIGLDVVLGEMALVHDGPVKPFQDAVLRAAGLQA